jgi:hypothetical protein
MEKSLVIASLALRKGRGRERRAISSGRSVEECRSSVVVGEEALEICHRLAAEHPSAYEPDVATTLNNLNLGTVLGDLGSGKWRGRPSRRRCGYINRFLSDGPKRLGKVSLDFASVGSRKVTAAFDGGAITSNAGALLLREADRAIGLSPQVAACFKDGRRQDRIEHAVETLVAQRIHGIALGYEDLNDHDELRHDPVLGLLRASLRHAGVTVQRWPAKQR